VSRNSGTNCLVLSPSRADGRSANESESGAEASSAGARASSVILLGEVRFHREALSRALSAYEDIALVGSVVDVYTAILLAEETRAEVLLVDSASVAVARALATHSLSCRVVFVGAAGDFDHYLAGKDGARFVDPTSSLDELHLALRSAALRSVVRRSPPNEPPGLSGGLAASTALALMTPRERAITCLVARGFSNKEIATACGISVATVKNHVHRVLRKLNLRRRSQIGRFAFNYPGETPDRWGASSELAPVPRDGSSGVRI